MKNNFLLISFLLSLFFTGCSSKKELVHVTGKTMGTTYSVKFYPASNDQKFFKIGKEISYILTDLNNQMSTYKNLSEISRFNKLPKNQAMKISLDFLLVTEEALKVANLTNGHFDPTLGPLINLWGFGPEGKRKVPSKNEIERERKKVGFKNIELNLVNGTLAKKIDGVYLDLSALAKGYAVDKISDFLLSKGIDSHMVEIGGEIKVRGQKEDGPWRVGIETPGKDGNTQKIIKLTKMAVATSGDYRNLFKEGDKYYSHTIDYKTGAPIDHRMTSVSVLNIDSCMKADAWATAFMAMGPKKSLQLAEKLGILAYFIYRDNGQGGSPLVEVASSRFKAHFNRKKEN